MERNIRLRNPQKFAIGVKTFDRPTGINIDPGSFIMVSEDDINYISSISDFLHRGMLLIEDSASSKAEKVAETVMESIGIVKENNPNFADDEEIRKILSGTAKKIGDWLDGVQEPFMLDRVYDIAMSMSDKLTANKLKVLQAKMPDRDFIG